MTKALTGSIHQLDVVAGLSDGILSALSLSAGVTLPGHAPLDLSLALRIAAAGAIAGAFVFMVAHYAELRGALVKAERELNLTSHGQLATSRLGRAAFMEAVVAALVASVCSFCGALVPLLVGVFVPQVRWLAVVVALLALGMLGYALASVVHGKPVRWMVAMFIAGIVMAFVGMRLDIA